MLPARLALPTAARPENPHSPLRHSAWSLLPNSPRYSNGEVAEWSIAADLKSAEPERVPGVRIPPSPLTLAARRHSGTAARKEQLRLACWRDEAEPFMARCDAAGIGAGAPSEAKQPRFGEAAGRTGNPKDWAEGPEPRQRRSQSLPLRRPDAITRRRKSAQRAVRARRRRAASPARPRQARPSGTAEGSGTTVTAKALSITIVKPLSAKVDQVAPASSVARKPS